MGALSEVAQHIFKRPISPLRSSIDSLIAHMFVRHVVGIFERFSVLLYIQLVNPFRTPCMAAKYLEFVPNHAGLGAPPK
jgi:hypothetical protein